MRVCLKSLPRHPRVIGRDSGHIPSRRHAVWSRNPKRGHHHNTETDGVEVVVVREGAMGSRPTVHAIFLPRTAAHQTKGTLIMTLRILSRRFGVVVFVPLILAPLPHVAVHVVKPKCV